MTNLTSRTSTRSLAAVAAVAAASTLAGCGSSDSNTASDVPNIKTSSSSSSSSATPSPSSSTKAPETTSAPKPATKTADTQRASRSQTRQAAPAVKVVNWSQTERIDNKTVYVYSKDLPKGTSKVTQAGQDGLATVTYRTTKDGQRILSTKAVDSKVTKNAVRRVITVGIGQAQPVAKKTFVQPQQVSRSTVRKAVTQRHAVVRKAATTQTRRSASAPVAANVGMWDRIAQCESTGRWNINTGNGYYGGLQFDIPTWLGAGGGAYAPRADLATKAQQIAIANKVYSQRGLQPWQCGWAA